MTVPPLKVVYEHAPTTDLQLWWAIYRLWNIQIPTQQVCDDHIPPFRFVADAYFARHPVIVVKASRGLAGKTFSLSALTVTETVFLGAEASLLGGSLAQSQNAHEYTQAFWEWTSEHWGHVGGPAHLLASDPTKAETHLHNGGKIRVLAASTKSVRGPHPQRLRLDEADEMSEFVFTSALGQPMSKPGIAAQTVIASTHHYPDKTFAYVLKQAKEKDWPVYSWCYRESQTKPIPPTDPYERSRSVHVATQQPLVDGWLHEVDIERTKATIPKSMWEVEYELGEPTIEGRAFDSDKVKLMFGGIEIEDRLGHHLILEEPVGGGARYITGIDWAKEQDWTIIATFRTDQRPWRLVAWYRNQRENWPVMVGAANERIRQYKGIVAHDSTGIGNVIDDYLIPGDATVHGITMVGEKRAVMFADAIVGVEAEQVTAPNIPFFKNEVLYCSRDDLFRSGVSFHPPDSVVALSLAWSQRDTAPIVGASSETLKQDSYWRS